MNRLNKKEYDISTLLESIESGKLNTGDILLSYLDPNDKSRSKYSTIVVIDKSGYGEYDDSGEPQIILDFVTDDVDDYFEYVYYERQIADDVCDFIGFKKSYHFSNIDSHSRIDWDEDRFILLKDLDEKDILYLEMKGVPGVVMSAIDKLKGMVFG